MKRRLFLSHTVSLMVGLLILLAVSGGVMHLTSQHQREVSGSSQYRQIAQVQALLNQRLGDEWSGLDVQLKALGYRLSVIEGNQRVIFTSFDPVQENLYWQAPHPNWPSEGSVSVQVDGVLMVGRQEGVHTVVAMPAPNLPNFMGRQRPWSETALLSLLVSGGTAILVVIVLSSIFTRNQVRRLMRPVDALTQAARRIEAGDLSRPIEYDGSDEFASVCAAFDHMQQHLRQEQEKNAHYEQARTDLVAGISHDLRTPLTAVKGYLKGLRDGVANTPEKQAVYLDVAYRRACDMERLLQQLFYFSKLETGNLPLHRTNTDLNAFVSRFADDIREELSPLGGSVECKCTSTPCPVQLDGEQMYRVLVNLKENALRYAGAEPLVITLAVWREGDKACLRFSDNGCGVAPEQLPRLFEQFWRADQSRGSSGGKGSGLGLYIVKYIVQAHGGTVAADNNLGLVLEIELPCEEELACAES